MIFYLFYPQDNNRLSRCFKVKLRLKFFVACRPWLFKYESISQFIIRWWITAHKTATRSDLNSPGVTYILDRPVLDCMQRDNQRLIQALRELRDISVIPSSSSRHDKEIMLSSDYLIDLGPGAGTHGGRVCSSGHSLKNLRRKDSLTASICMVVKTLKIPTQRRKEMERRSRSRCKDTTSKVWMSQSH